jgi:anion-transporting  ArsA/GET3 family ATPase
VTSPRRDAVEEARFFADRLADSDLSVAALVVNRVHPDFSDAREIPELRRRAEELRNTAANGTDRTSAPDARAAAARLASRYQNLADYAALGRREREQLAGVGERIAAGVVAYVPSLPHDVVDFAALDAVAGHLLNDSVSGQ